MKGGKKPRGRLRSGAEIDVVHERRFYSFTKIPGVTSKIKRQIRRRERHKGEEEWASNPI